MELDRLAGPLEAELEGLEREEAETQAKIEAAQQQKRTISDQRRQIEKAVKVLRGESLSKATPKPRSKEGWVPSDEVLRNVRAALDGLVEGRPDGGFYFFELAEASPHSSETTKRALEVFRKREIVRRAGRREAEGKRGKFDYWEADLIAEERAPVGETEEVLA